MKKKILCRIMAVVSIMLLFTLSLGNGITANAATKSALTIGIGDILNAGDEIEFLSADNRSKVYILYASEVEVKDGGTSYGSRVPYPGILSGELSTDGEIHTIDGTSENKWVVAVKMDYGTGSIIRLIVIPVPAIPDTPDTPAEPRAEEPKADPEPAAEPEPEKLPVNEVAHHVGDTTVPSLDGIYNSQSVNGCVVTTPLNSLETAAGLTTEQKEEGAVLKYYVCDSLPSKTKTLLQETVAADGYRLSSVINADLYLLQKGTVTPIRSVGEKIRIEIGIPQKLQKEGRKFFIVCFDSQGNKVIMDDLDNDFKSITIDTNIFGLFAICYED